jgi:hypothetical protein
LAWSKSNLAPTPDSLAYQLTNTPEHGCARVVWSGTSSHTAHTLLSVVGGGDDYGATTEAERWLEDYLSVEGPCLSKDVKAAAAKVGIKERTLQVARQNLEVVVNQKGFPRVTWWSMPFQSCQVVQSFSDCTTCTTDGSDCTTGHPGFTPPTGPGRCDECGFHTETQGHRDTCSKNADDEPLF